jgi:hypothetical protein
MRQTKLNYYKKACHKQNDLAYSSEEKNTFITSALNPVYNVGIGKILIDSTFETE